VICVSTESHTGRLSLQPSVDFRESCCEQVVESSGDTRRQRYSPLCRFGLHAKQNDLAGGLPEQVQRIQQVAESEQVHALAGRQVQEFLTREEGKSTRGRAEIHGIDGKKMRLPFEAGQQIEPEGTAFDGFDPGGKPTALKQYAYCVNAHAIVSAHQVPEAEDGDVRLGIQAHCLPRAADGLATGWPPPCFSPVRLLRTNFQPLKVLSIRPFFCFIETSTAL